MRNAHQNHLLDGKGLRYLREIVLPSVNLPEKPTYNLKETAVIFGVTPRTVSRRCHAGQLRKAPGGRFYLLEVARVFDEMS